MLLLLNTYPASVSQRFVFQSKKDSLQTKASMMSTTLSGLAELTPKNVSRFIGYLDTTGLSRIIVTNQSGVAVFDNSIMNNAEGRLILLPEVYNALSGSDVFYSRYTDAAFESKAAAPVILRGAVTGAVYLFEYDTEQAALLRGIQKNLANVSLVICLIVLLLSLFLPSMLTRRISTLLRAITEIEEGQYSHRAPIKGRDELASLAQAFNSMADRLQKTEEMRRQFISDASHELKTPLSSIRLLTDSILQTKDMSAAVLHEFVSDIGDEIDRLTRMTEKLLLLTRLDASLKTESTPVDIKNVILRAVHMLDPLASHEGVELCCQLDGGCVMLADEDNLYQAAFNLVENGIKYNKVGGRVTILLYQKEGEVIFIVDDTGIGIPQEDLPRIFDRFYRVDKARSRERGGSGLGLSIVRSNIESCGGSIRAESTLGKGSRFTVRFPFFTQRGIEDEKTGR